MQQRGVGRGYLLERVAGAPVSWGVNEVPGWGHQLSPDQVLGEMRDLGLTATELGPAGFLPADPQQRVRTLDAFGLHALGGFVPVVLHNPDHDPAPELRETLEEFAAAGAGTLVLAAATGRDGYDDRPALDASGWATLLGNLDRLDDLARDRGVTATLHPHVGTMVETAGDVARVLDGSAIGICLDTGHLLIGGSDPVDLAARHTERIAHVHLKDVDAAQAEQVRAGRVTYTEAVRSGMYRPLGQGDVDIAAIVTSLEASGYAGWYVLEQDAILAGPQDAPAALDDVRTSLAHLREVAASASASAR